MEVSLKKQANRMYSVEYKQEAIRLLEASGKSVAQLSRELGVSAKLTCPEFLKKMGTDVQPDTHLIIWNG